MKWTTVLTAIGWLAATACYAQTVAPPSAKKEPNAKSSPGWIVDVFEHTEWKDLDTSKDIVTRIVVRPSIFSLESHLQSFPSSNLIFYRGTAIFKPSEAGRFTFYMMPTEGFGGCVLKLLLADRPIINVAPPKYSGVNQAAVGGADLEPQAYSIQFLAGCNGNKNTISIKVRGPQEMSPRDFQSSELFFVRK